MEHTPNKSPPQWPRFALAVPLLPYLQTVSLTPREVIVERLAYAAEIEASRPSWQIALAGALAALGERR